MTHHFRRAEISESSTILHQRRQMWLAMNEPERANMSEETLRPWFEKNMLEGNYLGFFALSGNQIVGGAGLLLYHWLPTLDYSTLRGYIHHVYVEPEHRGLGLAKQLVQHALTVCTERNIKLVSLHASEMGRPIYESLGFKDQDEMLWNNL
jgi:GNAT superfamily N-acetyltransferase